MDGSAGWAEWQGFLYRVARGHFHLLDEDAREVGQETLLRMLQHPPRSTDPASVRAFALQILRRVVQDRFRRKERPSLRVPLDEPRREGRPLAELVGDERPSPEERTAAAERLRLVERALAGLQARPAPGAARDAGVFRRVVLGGEAPREVARDLGLAEDHVNLIVHRVRKALRAALQGGAP